MSGLLSEPGMKLAWSDVESAHVMPERMAASAQQRCWMPALRRGTASHNHTRIRKVDVPAFLASQL